MWPHMIYKYQRVTLGDLLPLDVDGASSFGGGCDNRSFVAGLDGGAPEGREGAPSGREGAPSGRDGPGGGSLLSCRGLPLY